MPCPFQWLVITDGTTNDAGIRNQVDFLSPAGFCLLEEGDWRPAISEPKGGGVWKDSQLADGRRPADFKAQNVIEQMTLTVTALDQDQLIKDTQELRRLLTKARTFGTTDWQTGPVWIEAQGNGETNMRYAVIWDWRTPNDTNPYEAPFWQQLARAGMDDFALSLEREPHWRSHQPRSGQDVEIAGYRIYNSRLYGNVDMTNQVPDYTDSSETVFVARKDNEANITHVHLWSFANGFSGNLIGTDPATLVDIAGAAPAVNDYTIFGCDTALADSGPFSSIVFNLTTAIGGMTLSWEYSNGAGGWLPLSTQDNTNQDGAGGGSPLDTLGVKGVFWDHPAGWGAQADGPGATVAYWVRAVITACPGPLVAPVQSGQIYSITWSFVEVDEDEIGGDYEALSMVRVDCQSDNWGGTPSNTDNRVIIGLRSVSRGTDFRAYINLANEQNATGVTVTAAGTGAFGAATYCAAGVALIVTNPAASAVVGYISMTPAMGQQYHGRYHVYLRGQQIGGAAGDITLYATLGTVLGVEEWISPTVTFPVVAAGVVLDLGPLTINSYTEGRQPAQNLTIRIYAAGNGATDCELFDVVFIPTDEWAVDSIDWVNSTGTTAIRMRNTAAGRSYVRIDGVSFLHNPGNQLRLHSTDVVTLNYQYISPSWPILHSTSKQRLWFLTANGYSLTAGWFCKAYGGGYSVNLQAVQRYYSMRGDR